MILRLEAGGNGVRRRLQVGAGSHRGRRLVVLHAHPDQLVHGEPGCLPDHRAHVHAHQERRRPRQAAHHQVRAARALSVPAACIFSYCVHRYGALSTGSSKEFFMVPALSPHTDQIIDLERHNCSRALLWHEITRMSAELEDPHVRAHVVVHVLQRRLHGEHHWGVFRVHERTSTDCPLALRLDMHLVSCSLAQDGVKQVIDSQGKYAFLLESTMNEYASRIPSGKCTSTYICTYP